METENPQRAARIEDWCEELVGAIAQRSAVTYAINEIIKTNTKNAWIDAALVYLKTRQTHENQKIKGYLDRLSRMSSGPDLEK